MSSVQDWLFEVRINRKPFTNTLRPGGSLIKIIGSVIVKSQQQRHNTQEKCNMLLSPRHQRCAATRGQRSLCRPGLACCRELKWPEDRTNPNGSGISLGHPVGATGCILTVKALYELARTEASVRLVTMCIGGGQGIAAICERPKNEQQNHNLTEH